jgi:hypothetical protein
MLVNFTWSGFLVKMAIKRDSLGKKSSLLQTLFLLVKTVPTHALFVKTLIVLKTSPTYVSAS